MSVFQDSLMSHYLVVKHLGGSVIPEKARGEGMFFSSTVSSDTTRVPMFATLHNGEICEIFLGAENHCYRITKHRRSSHPN